MALIYLWPKQRRSGTRHLAVLAHAHGMRYSSRWVPLCGQDRGRHWPIVGNWSENWSTAQDAPLCTRCLRVLADLNEAAKQ